MIETVDVEVCGVVPGRSDMVWLGPVCRKVDRGFSVMAARARVRAVK